MEHETFKGSDGNMHEVWRCDCGVILHCKACSDPAEEPRIVCRDCERERAGR